MIPKVFHFVWVGDQSKEPQSLIQSWAKYHPDYEVKVYRNADLFDKNWILKDKMLRLFEAQQYCGVADLIRWEVLASEGGIALDADSLCLHSLPNWIHTCTVAACWDNSKIEGHLLSNGFVAAVKNSKTILRLIEIIKHASLKTKRWSWSRLCYVPVGAWRTVGPVPFTKAALLSQINEITTLPSHFFLPIKADSTQYQGDGPVYACQFWLSTHKQDITKIDNISSKMTNQVTDWRQISDYMNA